MSAPVRNAHDAVEGAALEVQGLAHAAHALLACTGARSGRRVSYASEAVSSGRALKRDSGCAGIAFESRTSAQGAEVLGRLQRAASNGTFPLVSQLSSTQRALQTRIAPWGPRQRATPSQCGCGTRVRLQIGSGAAVRRSQLLPGNTTGSTTPPKRATVTQRRARARAALVMSHLRAGLDADTALRGLRGEQGTSRPEHPLSASTWVAPRTRPACRRWSCRRKQPGSASLEWKRFGRAFERG